MKSSAKAYTDKHHMWDIWKAHSIRLIQDNAKTSHHENQPPEVPHTSHRNPSFLKSHDLHCEALHL